MNGVLRGVRVLDLSHVVAGPYATMYLAMLGAYLFFEQLVVNRRPVLLDGFLEASYPSSTILLALCVLPSAIGQLNARIRHGLLRRCTVFALAALAAFMVVGRLLSGVHWLTDIVGSVLLSSGLYCLYRTAVTAMDHSCEK